MQNCLLLLYYILCKYKSYWNTLYIIGTICKLICYTRYMYIYINFNKKIYFYMIYDINNIIKKYK